METKDPNTILTKFYNSRKHRLHADLRVYEAPLSWNLFHNCWDDYQRVKVNEAHIKSVIHIASLMPYETLRCCASLLADGIEKFFNNNKPVAQPTLPFVPGEKNR